MSKHGEYMRIQGDIKLQLKILTVSNKVSINNSKMGHIYKQLLQYVIQRLIRYECENE